jgi:hypothetical protein
VIDLGPIVVGPRSTGVQEFVVFRTDLGPTELPTDENGAVDETGEGIELIGEIEDIPVGETKNVTWTWRPATTSSFATSGTRPNGNPTIRRGCPRPSR